MNLQSAIAHGLPFAFLFVFLGGLLTALTPCVYPLIPITVSIFGAKDARRRRDAVLLSATYVLGIAIMYTALGVLAAATGSLFGRVVASPIAIGVVALIFVLFALSMFGAFDLSLPPAWQARLSQLGGRGYPGALAMGLVAGIIAAPCTGPVLGAVLAYVATTQRLTFGAGLLFVYALGLGLPFFVLGSFAISLPKSGSWMEAVKSFFGVCMLILALYFLKDALPFLGRMVPVSREALWSGVAAVAAGLALGAIHLSFHGPRRERMRKAASIVLVVLGAHVVLVQLTRSEIPSYTSTAWLEKESEILGSAKAAGKPVVIDFGADWCAACRELEQKTYRDPQVRADLARFVFVKVDETRPSDADDVLAANYGVTGLPFVVFIDRTGTVRRDLSFFGFKPPDDFRRLLATLP